MTEEPQGRLRRAWSNQSARHEAAKDDRQTARQQRKELAAVTLVEFAAAYAGGHPAAPAPGGALVAFREHGVDVVAGKQAVSIPWSDITGIEVHGRNDVDVDKRYTATRIALMGPFALAKPKKTVTREVESFVTVFTTTGDLVFRLAGRDPHATRLSLAPAIAQVPARGGEAPSSDGDPLEQIRRLGELRDQGLLNDDEFAAKKAELLGRL